MRPRRIAMNGAAYEITAGIVRTLPEEIRQAVADHFATEFNRRSASFDPYQWEWRTGGKVRRDAA